MYNRPETSYLSVHLNQPLIWIEYRYNCSVFSIFSENMPLKTIEYKHAYLITYFGRKNGHTYNCISQENATLSCSLNLMLGELNIGVLYTGIFQENAIENCSPSSINNGRKLSI